MKALVYGVAPDAQPVPDDANELERGLAHTPMQLRDVPDARPLRPDWVVCRTRLTGVCGSDAKQVFGDFGNTGGASPLMSWFSLPQVLGHEVVGEVVELGPEARGVTLGQRVVLNPWLTCAPRGVSPLCDACVAGDLSQCWSFTAGDVAPGIHTGTSRDATGGFAELFPAHPSMLFPVPDDMRDEVAVLADPFAVSLHGITRHPPRVGGKVLVYGAGALGAMAVAILRALHPDVGIAVIARFPAQAALVRKLGADLVLEDPFDRLALIEQIAAWSGGKLVAIPKGLPMAHPGGVDVVYDTIGKAETYEVGVRVLRARGTLVQSGVHGAERWEASPLYFKEISFVGSNAFGVEEVAGERKHGIQHYLDLASRGRVDLDGLLTHTFALADWRAAFGALARQERSGAMKVAFDFR